MPYYKRIDNNVFISQWDTGKISPPRCYLHRTTNNHSSFDRYSSLGQFIPLGKGTIDELEPKAREVLSNGSFDRYLLARKMK